MSANPAPTPGDVLPVNCINGQWERGAGVERELRVPGDLDRLLARLRMADADQARRAADAAQAAQPAWGALPLARRMRLLEAFVDLIETRAGHFAETICAENGKCIGEAHGEVRATLADARYQLGQAEEMGDRECPEPGLREIRHLPRGLALVITPWNFPLAVVMRKLLPALVWGNAVLLKASEVTPLSAVELFRCLGEAGLPPGVANLLVGEGEALGPVLLDLPPDVVSFTGSTGVGRAIARRVAGLPVELQAEMGGKNPLIVLADADLDAAVEAAVLGAFSCAGQWCTGTSRAIVEAPVYERFCERLAERARALRVGPGQLETSQMGAVTSQAQHRKILGHIERAVEQGARLLAGGRALPEIDGCRGHFIEATVFADVGPEMELFREEVFGPVLAVTPAADLEQALALANDSPYGLSSSLFTRSRESAEYYYEHIQTGLAHLNHHSAFRTSDMPILGMKGSGLGPPECGRHAREFFTRPQARYGLP